MHDDFCLWEKTHNAHGEYRTSCGNTVKTCVSRIVYCPFCRNYILLNGLKYSHDNNFHKRYEKSRLRFLCKKHIEHDKKAVAWVLKNHVNQQNLRRISL